MSNNLTPFQSPAPLGKVAVVTKSLDADGPYRVLITDEGATTETYNHIRFKIVKGIVKVLDGSSGCAHTPFASIDSSGSVPGMIKNFGWGKKDRIIKTPGWKYNIDRLLFSDSLDYLSWVLMTQGMQWLPISPGETKRIPLKFETNNLNHLG